MCETSVKSKTQNHGRKASPFKFRIYTKSGWRNVVLLYSNQSKTSLNRAAFILEIDATYQCTDISEIPNPVFLKLHFYHPQVMFLHLSVCPRGGGCLSACWDNTPPEQVPPGSRHPPSRRLRLRTVRILLECILVPVSFWFYILLLNFDMSHFVCKISLSFRFRISLSDMTNYKSADF